MTQIRKINYINKTGLEQNYEDKEMYVLPGQQGVSDVEMDKLDVVRELWGNCIVGDFQGSGFGALPKDEEVEWIVSTADVSSLWAINTEIWSSENKGEPEYMALYMAYPAFYMVP